MISFLKQCSEYIAKFGLARFFSKGFEKLFNRKTQIIEEFEFIIENGPLKSTPPFEDELAETGNIRIAWIVPEFGKGSGGHINMFRFMKYLDSCGIENDIYCISLYYADRKRIAKKYPAGSDILKDVVRKYYGIEFSDTTRIKYIQNVDECRSAHIMAATYWKSAYFVRAFNRCLLKMYFVQDFEPAFYPWGSEYKFAENTYRFGFTGITVGSWLANKLQKEYNMKCYAMAYAYDKQFYGPQKDVVKKDRVLFYARPRTERRCFELGLLGLSLFAREYPEYEIAFAGADVKSYSVPFKYTNYGMLELKELAKIYAETKIVVALSATDLSLVPIEAMGCGTAVLVNRGDNTLWMCTEENSLLADFTPDSIARILIDHVSNPKKLERVSEQAQRFSEQNTWENEFALAKTFIGKELDGCRDEFKRRKRIIDESASGKGTAKLAAIVHLYYREIIDEICGFLKNIDEKFDLFVTVSNFITADDLESIRACFPSVRFFHYENRGRDIYPFLEVMKNVDMSGYDAVCKIHSKKSTHLSRSLNWTYSSGDNWRADLYAQLLGSPSRIRDIVTAFRNDPELGIAGPGKNLIDKNDPFFVLGNSGSLGEIRSRCGISPEDNRSFFAGSMFWFRPDALRKITDAGFTRDDFPDETGQIDSTAAHSVERLFNAAAVSGGYSIADCNDLSRRF